MTGYPWCRRSSRCWRLPNIFDPRLLSRESLTRFHSRSAPGITVLDYLRRIIRFTKVEVCPCARVACPHPSDASRKKSCLLLVLHYVDQICARMPLFTLSSLTCHRFIIASITVCSKGLCDTFCTNGLYARVGGIPPSELNVLEREFLRMIDWRLTVSTFSLAFYFYFFHLHLFRVRAIHLLFLLFPPPLYPDLDVSVSFPFVFISSSIFFDPGCSLRRFRQCTREVLQEYYVNLVRTDSSGRFYIPGSPCMAESAVSSESEPESMGSRSPSPVQGQSMDPRARLTAGMLSPSRHESSTILIDAARQVPQAPTLEQNMAFADLQSSLGRGTGGISFVRPS